MSIPAHFEDEKVVIRKIVVGPFENNVYVVGCKETGEAAIIDAANEADRIVEAAEGFEVRRVYTTHGHGDHVQAVDPVRDSMGVEVGIHEADVKLAGRRFDFTIAEGDDIPVGNLHLKAMHTPGHTPGGICFLYGESGGVAAKPGPATGSQGEEPGAQLRTPQSGMHLFSGDTLFPGGPGNTKNGTGHFPTIIESIRTRLFTLPDDTIVYPGHGLDTTIGTERPHLDEWIARGW